MMNWFFRGGLPAVQISREGVLLAEEPPLWKIAARHFWLAEHWLCTLDMIILDERIWCQMSRFQTGFGGKLYFEVTVISRRDCTARIIINLIQVWNVQPQQERENFFFSEDNMEAMRQWLSSIAIWTQKKFALTRRVQRRNWGGELGSFRKTKWLYSNPNSLLLAQDSEKILLHSSCFHRWE